jgi:hypothetical protein
LKFVFFVSLQSQVEKLKESEAPNDKLDGKLAGVPLNISIELPEPFD